MRFLALSMPSHRTLPRTTLGCTRLARSSWRPRLCRRASSEACLSSARAGECKEIRAALPQAHSYFLFCSFDVIRFIPPLNVTEQELAQAFDIFAQSVKEVAQSVGVKGE